MADSASPDGDDAGLVIEEFTTIAAATGWTLAGVGDWFVLDPAPLASASLFLSTPLPVAFVAVAVDAPPFALVGANAFAAAKAAAAEADWSADLSIGALSFGAAVAGGVGLAGGFVVALLGC
jgi:hypothetical protein